MDENYIEELIKDLKCHNPGDRSTAAEVFADAAREGEDITSAVPALVKALSDWYSEAARYAAKALVIHHTNKKEVAEIKKFFKSKSTFVIKSAANALANAAKNGQDITPAIPALINALSDKNEDIRGIATSVFTFHYVNKREWNKIVELLGHENEIVRMYAADALGSAAENGQDITPAIPALVNALSDKWDVRWHAARALDKFIGRCDSSEKLNEIQKVIENSFADWMKKQRGGPSPEKSLMQVGISHILVSIGKKKAELSKKDGELLLGETVKKPKDKDKKMYRNLRRVGKNG